MREQKPIKANNSSNNSDTNRMKQRRKENEIKTTTDNDDIDLYHQKRNEENFHLSFISLSLPNRTEDVSNQE